MPVKHVEININFIFLSFSVTENVLFSIPVNRWKDKKKKKKNRLIKTQHNWSVFRRDTLKIIILNKNA